MKCPKCGDTQLLVESTQMFAIYKENWKVVVPFDFLPDDSVYCNGCTLTTTVKECREEDKE